MTEKNNRKKDNCPLCKVSEETIEILKKAKENGEGLYQCPECKFFYKEKEWAEKCENWCRIHKSCNVEIIKHAIKK